MYVLTSDDVEVLHSFHKHFSGVVGHDGPETKEGIEFRFTKDLQ